jgi:type II secretory pathway component GspD/PulD (secretin)
VTLKVKDAPMKEVFREIQKQTGLDVFVDNALLQKAGKVTMNVSNMPVMEVLGICLKDEPLAYAIVDGRIVVRSKTDMTSSLNDNASFVAPILKGRVTGKDDIPLIGASIRVKGSDKATVTDDGGNFSIEANEGEIVVITYVGYKSQEIKVTGASINIELKIEVKSLDEVVMIGYGPAEKKVISHLRFPLLDLKRS